MKEITLGKPALKQLYQNLGADQGLRAVLHDFYKRMAQDVMIGFFFNGKDPTQIADRQMDFLKRAMGASDSYSGKPPTSAHSELPPILSGHFDRRLVILRETLKDHRLSDSDIEVWLSFENAFRESVVSS